MISQILCGEVGHVLALDGDWFRVELPDGMQGWLAHGGTYAVSGREGDDWQRSASIVSLGTTLTDLSERRAATPAAVPWGARLRPATDGRLELPDGASCRPAHPDSVVSTESRAQHFPARGADAATSALRWLGTPYLWGGRIETGADCSGFVQSVFRMHGVELPRDSAPQAECGTELASRPGEAPDLAAGDLLFFGSSDRPERVGHVGISLGGSRMVHCAAGNGGVAVNDLGGDLEYERLLAGLLMSARRPEGLS